MTAFEPYGRIEDVQHHETALGTFVTFQAWRDLWLAILTGETRERYGIPQDDGISYPAASGSTREEAVADMHEAMLRHALALVPTAEERP